MSKHTPGPWHIQDRGDTGNGPAAVGIICGPAHSSDWVADVGLLHDGAGGGSMANAHLIAAAPDLLEACRELVELWDANNPDDPCACMAQAPDDITAPGPCELCYARAAIAKAEGTSND